ncbi:XdhC family protein [Streptomyces sp. NPDC057638]|uniref:XdhC family protein n=1 Tax=Streptomyces sp. NPDC057638 TaxID=3346190 RepID=UPI0036809E3D
MLDIAAELHRWMAEGRAFAVATVVSVTGSAPRGPGAALAVDAEGTAVGSVSGGCVEGAVYELCERVLAEGRPAVARFDHSDEDAFAAGLMCGGSMEVLVTRHQGSAAPGSGREPGSVPERAPGRIPEPVRDRTPAPPPPPDASDPVATALAAVVQGRPAALVRVVDGGALTGRALLVRPDGTRSGTLGGGEALDRTAAAEARALLDTGRSATVRVGSGGGLCGTPLTLFVETSLPPARMIVFGAIDFAAALVRVGKFLGHHVTVCDARPVFATRARFPEADEVVVEWPHRYLATTATDSRTVLCVLTHDPRFDIPLLREALRLPVAYVGAMGSRRTHEDRVRRLREAGVAERELARLRSPIGLDLGARTPEETALSIAAEIVADRRGGGGTSLTGSLTPIHHDGRGVGGQAA